MSFSVAVYRLMVRAYPSRFFDGYAEEMVSLFSQQLRDAESKRRVARLWARTVEDWVLSVAVEHATEFRSRLARRRAAGPRRMVPFRSAVRRVLVFSPNIPVALLLLAGIVSYRVMRNLRS